ncbi:MAG: 30S ribosomal protein S16 [Candidatus Omnitrophica bacterium]|nr:30S ribosomal protein S16 [Candidatus Omnitrophota bacterium]
MSLMIRLRRIADTKGAHCFRVVAIAKERSRDGRNIEELGFYDPRSNPPVIKINRERIEHWIKNGAQLSNTVKDLMKKTKKGGK